jgi:hypothetical protein
MIAIPLNDLRPLNSLPRINLNKWMGDRAPMDYPGALDGHMYITEARDVRLMQRLKEKRRHDPISARSTLDIIEHHNTLDTSEAELLGIYSLKAPVTQQGIRHVAVLERQGELDRYLFCDAERLLIGLRVTGADEIRIAQGSAFSIAVVLCIREGVIAGGVMGCPTALWNKPFEVLYQEQENPS